MRHISRYLSNKIQSFSIKATDDNIKQIVKDELDRLGHNADLNHIDVSEVTDMNHLFCCGSFGILNSTYKDLNPDISKWDVSNVINMDCMFYECNKFNCCISQWDVSKVKDMSGMFKECKKFNQDLSQWDVSNVKDMQAMFSGCKNFNQDLSWWDVSNVINMDGMFNRCKTFNQDLSGWDVRKVINIDSIFIDCPIKEEFKPKFNI